MSSSSKRRESAKKQQPKILLSKRKRFVFRLILICLPILALALLEVSLRLFNYKGNLDLVVKEEINGKTYHTLNRNVGRKYFFQRGTSIAEPYEDTFELIKSPETVRIFCLGESTTLGFPYQFLGNFPKYLADRLQTLYPEKRIEVINVGISAISSFVVLDFVNELVNYQPDIFVLYMGHNEYYGAFGVGSTQSVGGNRTLIKLNLALSKFKLYLLLRDALLQAREMISGKSFVTRRGLTLMAEVVAEEHIPLESDEYKRGVDYFTANLEEITDIAHAHGIKMVVSNLISNLRDLAPFRSTFSAGISEEEKSRWQKEFDAGQAFEGNMDFDSAVSHYRSAIGIDRSPANGYFHLGKCYEALGDTAHAKSLYAEAKDRDALRFRGTEEFNQIIRSLCGRKNVTFVDMDSVFTVHSKRGIIGNDLMLEHLHPNSDGYFLMGKAFCRAILEHGLIEPNGYQRLGQDKDDNYYRAFSNLTQLDEAIARFAVRILKSQWPFSNSDKSAIPQPANRVEEIALGYMKGETAWWEAHDRLAIEAAKEKKYEDALDHYRAIAKAMPFFDYPYLAMGRLYKIQSRYKEAEEAFWRALGIHISQVGYIRLGELAVLQKNPDSALKSLEKAIEFDKILEPKLTATERAEAAYLKAFAYGLQGNEALAQSEIKKSLIYDSNFGPAKAAAQQLGIR